ncbi:MAG: class A beta-lactamase-related serine hydrolase [Candidatus Omnitrophica bacterium]|nr:class A beta-lactamase-related serine hydrolase [Candidatus Omnitrophota bacterium]
MSKKTFLIYVFIFTTFVLAVSFSFRYYFACQKKEKQRIALENKKIIWRSLKSSLVREAEKFNALAAILVKDLDSGWEISLNKEKVIPSASLAKIPIMLGVYKAAYEEKIDLETVIQLKDRHKVSGSGALKNMPVGSEFSIQKLTELMVSESDNTATNIIIDILGMEYLNNAFKEFGLKNTNLSRKMMEFDKRKRGIENFTTAKDMASILCKVYRNNFLNEEISKTCLSILKQQKVKDRIPSKLPAEAIIAHKTGLEENICHDVGIVFTPAGSFVICILTAGETESKIAKNFISEVSLITYRYYCRLQNQDYHK